MQNLFIGKGNLADSPELKRINGKNGEFAVASMRVMFGRYCQNEDGDVEQIGADRAAHDRERGGVDGADHGGPMLPTRAAAGSGPWCSAAVPVPGCADRE